MPQTILEMAKELVAEQIRVYHISPDDAQNLLRSTHTTLLSLHQTEGSDSALTSSQADGEVTPESWKRSISAPCRRRIGVSDDRSGLKEHPVPTTVRRASNGLKTWKQGAEHSICGARADKLKPTRRCRSG